MMKEAKPFVHWQRGQTPRLCLCTKSWVWRAVWGETFTHGSVRGWGWNSLALLDICPTSIISAPTVIVGESWVYFDDRWGENYLFSSTRKLQFYVELAGKILYRFGSKTVSPISPLQSPCPSRSWCRRVIGKGTLVHSLGSMDLSLWFRKKLSSS